MLPLHERLPQEAGLLSHLNPSERHANGICHVAQHPISVHFAPPWLVLWADGCKPSGKELVIGEFGEGTHGGNRNGSLLSNFGLRGYWAGASLRVAHSSRSH